MMMCGEPYLQAGSLLPIFNVMMLCFIVVAVVVTLVIHILSVIVVVKAVVKTVAVVFYCSC